MLNNVQFSCFLLSYLLAFGLEVWSVARKSLLARLLAIGLSVAGLVAHSAYLVIRSREANLPPLLSSTQDWLLVLAWLGVVLYLAILALDRNLPLGLFLFPAILALIGSAFFVDDDPNKLIVEHALQRSGMRWSMLHASALVIGTCGVLMGFILSIMYLLQHRRLRQKKHSDPRVPLPNLEKLAALNWWAVVLAVPFLTIGLLAGVVLGRLSETTEAEFSYADPIVLTNAVVWVVMAALFFRLVRRREASGRAVAWQTVWAFGFLIITIVGLNLLTGDGRLDSFHSGTQPATLEEVGRSSVDRIASPRTGGFS